MWTPIGSKKLHAIEPTKQLIFLRKLLVSAFSCVVGLWRGLIVRLNTAGLYFMYCYVKSVFYTDKPKTIDIL